MNPAVGKPYVPETVLAAMRQTNELFSSEVVAKKDFEALDRIYTRNARILPPGAPMVEGRDQIKSFWKQAIAALGVTHVKLQTVDAQPAGEDVIEIGRAELTVAGGQGVSVKYVVDWKREDQQWKWNIDIWNSNQ